MDVVSLYRKIVYKAWLLKSREEHRHDMLVHQWAARAYASLREMPGMMEWGMRYEIWRSVSNIAYNTTD